MTATRTIAIPARSIRKRPPSDPPSPIPCHHIPRHPVGGSFFLTRPNVALTRPSQAPRPPLLILHNYHVPFLLLLSKKYFKNPLTFSSCCAIIIKSSGTLLPQDNLGVAQLVARYLGVVEAASSSLVTQTKTRVHNEPSFFFYFLAKSLEISRFRDKHNGLILPCFEG